MRKKGLFKKTVVLTLAACMAATVVGCGNTAETEQSAQGTEQAAEQAASEGQEAPAKSDKEVTINVMVWDRGNAAPNTTTEDNALTKWLAEQMKELYNINVEYTAVPRSGSDDKLNIMMSGGTAPDIVFTYDQALFYNYASNGALYDMTELYTQYGSDIEKYCGEAQSVSLIGDSRYAVMKQRGTNNPRHVAYIRQDWLDELNMEIPKTKEELGEYLYAAKEAGLGGEKTIPWAMSGRADTEKMYANFVGSYVNLESEKDAYIYSEAYIVAAPEAKEGLAQLNQWYKDGLITQDFPVDTTEDVFKADVANGSVGFVLDDMSAPWASFEVLNNALGHETFVPVQCFDLEDGSYRTPHEYAHAMYVMIPATASDEKAEACMKYLNWLADPANAVLVRHTPDLTYNDLGVAIEPSQDDKNAKGYPGTCDDLCIVNLRFDWVNDLDVLAKTDFQNQATPWASEEWYKNYYTTRSEGKFTFPVFAAIPEDETIYGADIKTRMIEFVYTCICADDFETAYTKGYEELVNAGLQKILDGRAAYYDSLQK